MNPAKLGTVQIGGQTQKKFGHQSRNHEDLCVKAQCCIQINGLLVSHASEIWKKPPKKEQTIYDC